MSIESGGHIPPEYEYSEREKALEKLQRVRQDLLALAESVKFVESVHRRDAVVDLCKGIDALIDEEINLLKEPQSKSTNQVAEAFIKQAIQKLDYDSQKRNPSNSFHAGSV
jgi:hypothetical protein